MRSVLDPKRHYKKEQDKSKEPQFSQVGLILEGPTEYYSSRLSRQERKVTLLDELLASEAVTDRFKNKYNMIQSSKASGRKAHYTTLIAKRKRKLRK